jgi:transposase
LTDGAVFKDFIEQLLYHCRLYLQLKLVLVMDNALFYSSERITQICCNAGVKLLYLLPYLLDFNPIEEFFAELKAFIKKQWHEFESSSHEEFGAYLEWCISVVGGREESAKGHFRNAGVSLEKLGSCTSLR